MLRAIVIDDIQAIRKKNIDLIEKHCSNVKILAEADGVESAVIAIKQYLPDLIFLDIEMQDGTGFDVLQQLKPINFKVIFITGHEAFATKAFRFSALDYLLKPLNPINLIEAVNKATNSIDKELLELKFNTLFSNLERPKDLQKIILKTNDKIFSVNVQDVVRCESEKNYTTFYLLDGQKLLVSSTLKEYDSILCPMGFFRCHQSHLVNMTYFDYFSKAEGGTIIMKDKSVVPLAIRKKEEFLALLGAI